MSIFGMLQNLGLLLPDTSDLVHTPAQRVEGHMQLTIVMLNLVVTVEWFER